MLERFCRWYLRRPPKARSSSELWPFLKALGAPDGCTEFHLIARVDSAVTAKATYFPSLELDSKGELQKMTKHYVLKKVESDGDG